MDSEKFDFVARLLSGGKTRREALRTMLAGSAAVAAGASLLSVDASAKPKKRRPKKRRKNRCKKAGQFCKTNKQCCTGKTKRRCAVASNAGNSDKTCCGGPGAVCGGANADGDALGPFCCAGFMCSSNSRAKGRCVRVPADQE
jgi:hypothetical protein